MSLKKLTLILVLLCPLCLSAYAQKITIKANQVRLEQILDDISRQSGSSFYYSQPTVNPDELFSLNVEKADLKTALDQLLSGKPLTYDIKNSKVYLVAKEPQSAPKTVKGTVVDVEGAPLIGAVVLIKGTTKGTTTDFEGKFSLNGVTEKTVLEVSLIGYQTNDILVGKQSVFTVTLAEDKELLDEVVVVGYGTMRRSLVTSAISKVGIDEENMRTVASPTELLNGRVAGVTTYTGSGNLGSGERMQIRGASSLNAKNEPLYVIDGVPITNGNANLTNFGEDMSSLSMLNLSDIESIEILKDAASAAIYGSRATNGVVLITTRAGSEGKASFRVNVSTGLSQFPNIDKVKMVNSEQYVDAYNIGVDNYNKQYGYKLGDSGYKEHIVNPFGNLEDYDWMRAITQLGKFATADLSVAGGSKKTNYYIGASASHREGIIRTNEMNKINLSFKLNHKFNDWLEVGANNSGNYVKNHQVPGHNSGTMIIGRAIMQRPFDRPYAPDGSYFIGGTDALTFHNALQILNEEIAYIENFRFIGSYYATLKFWEDRITFKNTFNTDVLALYDYTNYFSTHPYGEGVGLITDRNQTSINYSVESVLNYNDSFLDEDLTLNAMLGHSYYAYDYHNVMLQGKGFPSKTLDVVGLAAEVADYSGGAGSYRMESYFGRLSASYKSRYLLTATLRTDGSSKFAKAYRWGWFPSLSLGWNISNEPFMENAEGVDLKFRISYGKTGNQEGIGNYAYQPKLSAGYNYGNESGFAVSDFGNEHLTWEKADQFDVGLDMGFFDDRLTLIVDAYLKNTNDLLYSMPIHGTTGRTTMLTNIGSMRNKGIELTIGGSLDFGPVHWDSNLNISTNKNEVMSLLGDDEPVSIGANRILQVGKPIGTFWLFQQDGIYQYDAEVPKPQYDQGVRAGDVKWHDSDGNGVIEDSDRIAMGSSDPKFFGGWNNTFSWKGLSLNVFFTYMYGNQTYLGQGLNFTRTGYTRSTILEYNEKAWTGPGTTNTYPRIINGSSWNQKNSDMLLQDGSFIRLRALTLAYKLPRKALDKMKMKGFRIYLQGDNLFLLTKYPGWDPEVSANLDPRFFGVDNLSVPQPRTYTFGVNLTF
jgi:TonB-linked SusC/RagA family outer membrane protein